MSQDRELLELAARAAGIGPVLCYESARNCLRIGNRERYTLWRPLTDDGDALRLAIALRITIEFDGCYIFANAACVELPAEGVNEIAEAVRRAIVVAAAEIGRVMP